MFRQLSKHANLNNLTSPSVLRSVRLAHRAVVFTDNGDPASVLKTVTYPTLPAPPRDNVNVRFRISPINPSDINVIEGVYPSKPAPSDSLSPGHRLQQPVYVPGNEGLAEVTEVGENVKGLKKGDWVILAKQQPGTWSSARTISVEDVVKLPVDLSEVNAATITVSLLDIYLAHLAYVMSRLTHLPRIICCALLLISRKETGLSKMVRSRLHSVKIKTLDLMKVRC